MLLRNHCTYNGMVSRCDENHWENQKDCPFSVKSVRREACQFWCLDNRCDSYLAQYDRDAEEPEEMV